MVVLIKKSVCVDCIWKESCQSLARINGMADNRRNPGHVNDIIETIIVTCTLKNYDRSYKCDDNGGMYYCIECNSMHHSYSRIGINHKKKESLSEIVNEGS